MDMETMDILHVGCCFLLHILQRSPDIYTDVSILIDRVVLGDAVYTALHAV